MKILKVKKNSVPKLNSSCLWEGDIENLLDSLPKDIKFNFIATSPPYNLDKEYEVKQKFNDFLKWQEDIISKLVRRLKPNSSICWQVGNYVKDGEIFPLDIYQAPIFKKHGLKLRNRIIWTYEHGFSAANRFAGRYETILWFTNGDDYTFNLDELREKQKYPSKRHSQGPKGPLKAPSEGLLTYRVSKKEGIREFFIKSKGERFSIGKADIKREVLIKTNSFVKKGEVLIKGLPSGNPKGKNPGDVWNIPNVNSQHVEKTMHPCQYPVELIQRLVKSFTNPGDLVFDPFSGVATTGCAALIEKRHYWGCEINTKYNKEALKRLKAADLGILKHRKAGTAIYDHKVSDLSAIPNEWIDL